MYAFVRTGYGSNGIQLRAPLVSTPKIPGQILQVSITGFFYMYLLVTFAEIFSCPLVSKCLEATPCESAQLSSRTAQKLKGPTAVPPPKLDSESS